ncbi:hypothetical protein VE02_08919 [Pseudogymnoascus sp. 03VT05]|nr:hypothetical protein VE02_08919 [Pseudogymnoascus sp. 03VT05]
MDQYVDFWNLMAYDYVWSGSPQTGHQANLFPANDGSTPFDTLTAVNYYISKGVAPQNIVLGMPIYGRAFDATAGAGLPFDGVSLGKWEPGVYDFKDLPLIGAKEHFDSKLGKMELGGAMWWESSADALGSKSLIRSVCLALGGQDGLGLERTSNRLAYLDSTYANLGAGMPDSGSASKSTSGSTKSTVSSASSATSSLSRRASSTTVTVTLTTTITAPNQ